MQRSRGRREQGRVRQTDGWRSGVGRERTNEAEEVGRPGACSQVALSSGQSGSNPHMLDSSSESDFRFRKITAAGGWRLDRRGRVRRKESFFHLC